VSGAYYRDNLFAKNLLIEPTDRHIPDIRGWGFVFQQDDTLVHRARDMYRHFSGAKVASLHFSNSVAAEFTGSELSRL